MKNRRTCTQVELYYEFPSVSFNWAAVILQPLMQKTGGMGALGYHLQIY
jgi:hypothetical protein